jgi:hypothetical protein
VSRKGPFWPIAVSRVWDEQWHNQTFDLMERERSWRLTREGSAQMNLEVRIFIQTAALVAAIGNSEKGVLFA